MKCVSALSLATQTNAAVDEILEKLRHGMGGNQSDLTLIFASIHHVDEMADIAGSLMERGLTRHVLGCTGESVLAEDREIERDPALAAWSITLPGVEIEPIRLTSDGQSAIERLQRIENRQQSVLLLLGDPFSFRIDEFLGAINEKARGLRIVGGMASGSQVPRGNQVILDSQYFNDGAVAVLLSGSLSFQTIVSQGCRPIGHTMLITKADKNVIRELGRRPALEALREMVQELPRQDFRKMADGLHLGRVINEYQDTFQRGDFLVRDVMGADNSGAIHINELVRIGQTVQFHVRDADTADEDLRENLVRARERSWRTGKPAGALMFTCNGRGSRLFDIPDHDISLVHEVLGPIPVAGLFAMGEIGPIGGQNFMHGFTASVLVFEQPT